MPAYPAPRAVPAALLAALAVLACDADTAPGGDGAEAAATPGANAGVIQGTPDGDLQQWIADMREELGALPALADTAPTAARQRAVELYVGRQEFIELYYGDGGRLAGGPELATAVDEAESRFHELMILLGSDPPPSREDVDGAAERLQAAHQRVLDRARAAGVPLDPHAAAEMAT